MQIVTLEKKLEKAEELLSKNVRNLTSQVEEKGGVLKNPMLKLVHEFKGHKDIINCTALHPTEPVFASGSQDSTIRLYDYELFKQIIVL